MKIQTILIGWLAIFVVLPQLVPAQVRLVQNHQPRAAIRCVSNDAYTLRASALLQRFVFEVSGAAIPVLKSEKGTKAVSVYLDNRPENKSLGIQEDGFQLRTIEKEVWIKASGDKGILYGVVELLDRHLGVKYFGAHAYVAPLRASIEIPRLDTLINPAFRYRQTQFYGMEQDSLYAVWHRLEEPSDMFVRNYWVHTFDRILPSETYGTLHPEFYSFFKGKRNPGKASQWCLTNDVLFEEVCTKLDSLFAADPSKRLISVSQNDGNFTNCACPGCSRLDQQNGSPSGSLVYFLNKLASRYPEKEFSTLAYLYSMPPPRLLKPLPNVNIMLCSIDADREVPLTDNPSGRKFVEALEGWSAISNNLFIWDYGINFDNYLAPFPNFHVLKDNIQRFQANHATMHFSQIGGAYGGNFSELRAYLVAHLLWNPAADTDQLMQEFLHGYYGAAASYLYQYIKIMEGALLASGTRLWIYDSPVTHKNGMLRPSLLRTYQRLFDAAEAAVGKEEVFLKRVQMARLPLLYSSLEIARTNPEMDMVQVEADLNRFEHLVTAFQITSLNERNNSPLDYCALYRTRYLHKKVHLATGKKVAFITPPHTRYQHMAGYALTDGLYGGTTFVESWVGWEGQDASMVLDLEKTESIRQVSMDFLHQLGAWILLPKKVTFSYSVDGVTYLPWQVVEKEEDRDPAVKFVAYTARSAAKIEARYIKMEVSGVNSCPQWHYGVGYPCWFFLDEIKVD